MAKSSIIILGISYFVNSPVSVLLPGCGYRFSFFIYKLNTVEKLKFSLIMPGSINAHKCIFIAKRKAKH